MGGCGHEGEGRIRQTETTVVVVEGVRMDGDEFGGGFAVKEGGMGKE